MSRNVHATTPTTACAVRDKFHDDQVDAIVRNFNVTLQGEPNSAEMWRLDFPPHTPWRVKSTVRDEFALAGWRVVAYGDVALTLAEPKS